LPQPPGPPPHQAEAEEEATTRVAAEIKVASVFMSYLHIRIKNVLKILHVLQ
jgi:hypothetical protein